MNKERRKRLEEACEFLDRAKSIVEECASEERDYFDNMPENMQDGEKGSKVSEVADALEAIPDEIDEVTSAIEEVV